MSDRLEEDQKKENKKEAPDIEGHVLEDKKEEPDVEGHVLERVERVEEKKE